MGQLKHLVVIGTLCGAVALVGVAGCSSTTDREAKETGRTSAQVSTDRSISDRVSSALKTAPVYKYPNVHVNTFNGSVQLSGFVHTQGQKDEATRIAQGVQGVSLVHNDMVVQPLTPTGRTNTMNQTYQAPVVTPPQNEGSQPTPPPQPQPAPPPKEQPTPPQPQPQSQGTPAQPSPGSQP